MIASTSASIIDWICWIWVLASPCASVIDQLVDEALLLQLLDLVLDRALGLLHPGRHRIDVGPADRVGRLAVALDAVGGGVGLDAEPDGGEDAKAEGAGSRPLGRALFHCFPFRGLWGRYRAGPPADRCQCWCIHG